VNNNVCAITLNACTFGVYKQKRDTATNKMSQFINLLQMQIYHLQDFIGEFSRNSVSPNTFTSTSIDTSVILRVRTNPLPHQTRYYLVYRKGKGKAHYLSALWNSSTTAKNGINEYFITDTQGVKGVVEIDMFTLRIKKP